MKTVNSELGATISINLRTVGKNLYNLEIKRGNIVCLKEKYHLADGKFVDDRLPIFELSFDHRPSIKERVMSLVEESDGVYLMNEGKRFLQMCGKDSWKIWNKRTYGDQFMKAQMQFAM